MIRRLAIAAPLPLLVAAGPAAPDPIAARGSLSDPTVPFASRRAIRYMARLKASEEYRDALAAWQKGR